MHGSDLVLENFIFFEGFCFWLSSSCIIIPPTDREMRYATFWQKVSTLLLGQLSFTLEHWSQFTNSERFYPTCQRPGLKPLYFWTLVEEHITLRRVRESRIKGEENAYMFLFVSLGGREHWDCRAGCLLTMLKWPLKKGSAMLGQSTHFLCRLCIHRTHTKVCVCALKLCHHLISAHV